MRSRYQAFQCSLVLLIAVFIAASGALIARAEDDPNPLAGVQPQFQTTVEEVNPGVESEVSAAIERIAAVVPLNARDKGAIARMIGFYRSERVRTVALALTLGFVNGSAATYSLIVGGADLNQALPVGIALGTFGATIRIFIQRYLAFITGGKTKFSNAMRFFGLEFGFISLAKAVSIATGISHQGPLEIAGAVFLTSALGTMNQGAYDLAIAENQNRRLASASTETERKAIRLRSAVKSALISLASVAIGVAAVNDPAHALPLLGAFSVTGVTYYLRTFYGQCKKALGGGA